MFYLHLFFSLCFALIVAAVFTLATRPKSGDFNFLKVLAVIFFATWAGGLWLAPMGPVVWSVYWLPFFLTALIIAILLAAFPGAAGRQRRSTLTLERAEDRKNRRTNRMALNVFFWILLAVLFLAVASGYLRQLPEG